MRRAVFLGALMMVLACTGCFGRRHKQPQLQPVYSDFEQPAVTNAPPAKPQPENPPAAITQPENPPVAKALVTNAPATNAPANTNIFSITPDQSPNGRVSVVKTNLGYVVLSFPLGQVPPADQHMNIYHEGSKVGEVKVTEMRRDDNAVADIVAGDPQVGDEAREK